MTHSRDVTSFEPVEFGGHATQKYAQLCISPKYETGNSALLWRVFRVKIE